MRPKPGSLSAPRPQETESPFTLVAMADSEMQLGNDSEAVGYLKKAKRRYPREPEVYMGMARFARKMEKPDRAKRYLRKAEKLARVDARGTLRSAAAGGIR